MTMVRTIPFLAWRSLWNRRLTSVLTILTIALSVALLIGVTNLRQAARDSFAGVISGTDLIVGPPAGAVQLLLYTVFHMGSPTANVPFAAYQEVRGHPAVAWTIPLSLGDSHRGHRVVATNEDFYTYYRFHGDRQIAFSAGRAPTGLWDVAIGNDVARALAYELGQPVVVAHGLSSVGILEHDDKPFNVVGIMERTGTPIDRSVYVTLEGFEAMHIDWQSGAPPRPGERVPAEDIRPEDIRVSEITAFLVGTNSRIEALGLQREINTAPGRELMAILPGVTISELWRVVGYAESAMFLVSIFVVAVGLLGMLMTLYTSLDARRREMAILRALGMGARGITGLLILEAALLSSTAAFLGTGGVYAIIAAVRPWVRSEFGLELPLHPPSTTEGLFLLAVIVAGTAMAIAPAIKAYRNALTDGLTVRL